MGANLGSLLTGLSVPVAVIAALVVAFRAVAQYGPSWIEAISTRRLQIEQVALIRERLAFLREVWSTVTLAEQKLLLVDVLDDVNEEIEHLTQASDEIEKASMVASSARKRRSSHLTA